jgi:hypothetical protein
MLANLRALFGCLVDIILLRRGPEHLPASAPLLVVVVALNIVLYAIAYRMFLAPLRPEMSATWALQIIAGALITLAWFRVAFQIVKKNERFVQTMIAVFATNTMFIPAVPLVAALTPYLDPKPGSPPAPTALVLLTSFVGLWVLVVLSRIVRSAFEWSWVGAVFFVIAINLGAPILLGLIFGDLQKPA